MRILFFFLVWMITSTELLAQAHTYNYKITGVVKGYYGKKLYLEKLYLNKVTILDSIVRNKKDNSFSFSGKESEMALYRVRIGESGNDSYLITIDKPTNNIVLSGDSSSIPLFNYAVTGSVGSEQIRMLIHKAMENYNLMNSIDNKIYANPYMSEKELNDLQMQRDAINNNHITYVSQFIDTVSNPVVLIFCTMSLLNPEESFELWQKTANRLQQKAYTFTLAQEFTQQVKEIEEMIHLQNNPPQGLSIGAIAPDIMLKDTAGNEITLSSLKGKYVLIDFWASWCGPCRIENPNVVSAYNKYKDKGFTIYSVSLDQDMARWKKAILVDKLSWPYHVSELKGWNSKVCQEYNITSIPNNFLLDPDGKIIAIGLRGENLHHTLQQFLNQ
jgi:thiol-disulfide isomerase/thioredoxin